MQSVFIKQLFFTITCTLLVACSKPPSATPQPLTKVTMRQPSAKQVATNIALSGDLLIPGYTKKTLEHQADYPTSTHTSTQNDFTHLSLATYTQISKQADHDVAHILSQLQPNTSMNDKLIALSQMPEITGHPYITLGAEGEGNWPTNHPPPHTTTHIQQNPVYRTDRYNCHTLTNLVLGLLHSNNLKTFKQNILKVEYGAANLPPDSIHYYNRNNFTSASYNPVNETNGYIKDITPPDYLISANINIERWLHYQAKPDNLKTNVRVLDKLDGPKMIARFSKNYPPNYAALKSHTVTLSYIPKNKFVTKTNHDYHANEAAINQLVTPALVEVVRDDTKWIIEGKPITKIIGSGINVSHIGILYRQTFHQGETIFQKINCHYQNKQTSCSVKPVLCNKNLCPEVMLFSASNAYPNHYYWYQQNRQYHCNKIKPSPGIKYSTCNRVLKMPLANYLTQKQFGVYAFMDSPSIIGLHLEKLL